jgi:hypothetical protein
VVDLVAWIAAHPRTYPETMEVWRTSCPRLPIWEDAIRSRFVAVVWDDERGERMVVVTEEGRAFLGRPPIVT